MSRLSTFAKLRCISASRKDAEARSRPAARRLFGPSCSDYLSLRPQSLERRQLHMH